MRPGSSGAVPLPWIPDTIKRRVRGSLVCDIAKRHGLALGRDARDVLAEPAGTEGRKGVGRHVRGFVAGKLLARLGPFAIFPPIKAGLEIFVLGHLFQRYLETVRTETGKRMDAVEARRVRQAIDQALRYAVTVDTRERGAGAASHAKDEHDDRDGVTAFVDDVLARVAGVPGWLVTRIDAAFDERYSLEGS